MRSHVVPRTADVKVNVKVTRTAKFAVIDHPESSLHPSSLQYTNQSSSSITICGIPALSIRGGGAALRMQVMVRMSWQSSCEV